MKRFLIAFLFLHLLFPAMAQEKLGVSNSNYSSINSIFLNPSSSVDSWTLAQLNIVGANIYGMNNIAYLPQFSIWSAKNGQIQDPALSTIRLKKFVDFKVEVNGPAFVFSYKEIGAGLFVRGRVEGSVNNVPQELVDLVLQKDFDSLSKNVDIDIRNTRVSQMAWVEYGVNFGKMYFKHGKILITMGGNAKYLTGINIAYGNIYRLNAKINDAQFDIYNLRAKARYNEPGWNTGKGFGLDLGVTYKKTLEYVDTYFSNSPKSNCKHIDYKYKIGVSLLDVGALRFNKNTFSGDISGSATIMDFKHGNVDSVLRADFNVTQQKDVPIWACLPTALSVQAEYNLGRHFYANATAIQGLTLARMVGVQRTNLLSLALRYERKNIEIAVPLTLHRYIYPQLGMAIRFRTFVIGMDNVLPMITDNNTYGANFYFNLGFSMFKNPACKPSKKRYYPPKPPFEGYTFLSLKSKSRSKIAANNQGMDPRALLPAEGGKISKKGGKKKRFRLFRRKSKKI